MARHALINIAYALEGGNISNTTQEGVGTPQNPNPGMGGGATKQYIITVAVE